MTPKSKKILFWSLGSVGAVLILLLIAACVICSMLFSGKPFHPQSAKITPQDSAALSGMMIQVLVAIQQKNPPASDTIVMTDGQFNAMMSAVLASGAGISARKSGLNPAVTRSIVLKLDRGVFTLWCPAAMKFKTPFGKYINTVTTFTFGYSDGREHLKILSFQAGKFHIPASSVQNSVDRQIAERWSGSDSERMLKECLVSFRASDGKAEIVYRPAAVMKIRSDHALRRTPLNGGVPP